MSVLIYLFYSFAAIAIVWETIRFFGFNPLKNWNELNAKFKEEQAYNKTIQDAEIGDELYLKDKKVEATVGVLVYGCSTFAFTMTYWLWTLIGLTSSQWQSFLALLCLSFVYGGVQKLLGTEGLKADIALRIDAAISVVILIFILVNKFQLGWTF